MIDMNSRLLWMNHNYKKNSKKTEEDLMKPQMNQQEEGLESSTLGSLFPMLIQETPKTYSSKFRKKKNIIFNLFSLIKHKQIL